MPTYTTQPDDSSACNVYIEDSSPPANHDGETVLITGEGSGVVQRTLLKFDLSAIPSGAQVTSAALSLTPVAETSSNSRTLSAYRLKRAWVEGETTWGYFATGCAWQTAGAGGANDRESSPLGGVSVSASIPLETPLSISLDPALVQEWVSGAFTNHGMILQVDSEETDEVQWASASHATSAYRPKLTIVYTLPAFTPRVVVY